LQNKQNQPLLDIISSKLPAITKWYTQIIMGVADYSKRQLKTVRFLI